MIAHDGEETIEIFTTHRDRMALLLLDVILSRQSGPEAFSTMKALNPNVCVVFATGYNNETAMTADLVESGAEVLGKPYSLSALCRPVCEVLDTTAPASF